MLKKRLAPIVLDVAILGAGPSAAFAIQACHDQGLIPTVYTPRPPAYPSTAFFLHWVPKTVRLRQQHKKPVFWLGLGNQENYASKMWNLPKLQTSFPGRPFLQTGYDPEILLEMWHWGNFKHCEQMSDRDVQKLAQQYDLVFQTFPSQASQERRAGKLVRYPILSRSAPSLPILVLLYLGDLESDWTRISFGHGRVDIEFAYRPEESIPFLTGDWDMRWGRDLLPNTKPYNTGLDMNVIPLGRFACWDRKFLAHQAYEQVLANLAKPPY